MGTPGQSRFESAQVSRQRGCLLDQRPGDRGAEPRGAAPVALNGFGFEARSEKRRTSDERRG